MIPSKMLLIGSPFQHRMNVACHHGALVLNNPRGRLQRKVVQKVQRTSRSVTCKRSPTRSIKLIICRVVFQQRLDNAVSLFIREQISGISHRFVLQISAEPCLVYLNGGAVEHTRHVILGNFAQSRHPAVSLEVLEKLIQEPVESGSSDTIRKSVQICVRNTVKLRHPQTHRCGNISGLFLIGSPEVVMP